MHPVARCLVAAVVATGCQRDPAPAPVPVDAATAPSVVASATPPAPAEPVTVRLAVTAAVSAKAGGAQRVVVSVVAPELGLNERVAELGFPDVCEAASDEGGTWQVRCTPLVFHPVVEAHVEAGALSLGVRTPALADSAPPLRTRTFPIPPGRTVSFEAGRAHVRSLPEAACAPTGEPRSVDVKLPSHNTTHHLGQYGRSVFIAVPGSTPFLIARHRQYELVCKAEQDSELDYRVTCGKAAVACSSRVEGDLVRFECTSPAHYWGSVLLPCGTRGRFRKGAFYTEEHYI